MGFVEQELTESEEVVYSTKLHWIVFRNAATFVVLGVVALGVRAGSATPLALMVAVLLAFNSGIKRMSSEFAVTNQRVMLKTGLIQRHAVMMLLGKIESVIVDQGILGRILNYGSVSIGGSGGGKEVFRNVARPMEFRKEVEEAAERRETAGI